MRIINEDKRRPIRRTKHFKKINEGYGDKQAIKVKNISFFKTPPDELTVYIDEGYKDETTPFYNAIDKEILDKIGGLEYTYDILG